MRAWVIGLQAWYLRYQAETVYSPLNAVMMKNVASSGDYEGWRLRLGVTAPCSPEAWDGPGFDLGLRHSLYERGMRSGPLRAR
jgi:hypothetical protein